MDGFKRLESVTSIYRLGPVKLVLWLGLGVLLLSEELLSTTNEFCFP